jgi:hypothetical protein
MDEHVAGDLKVKLAAAAELGAIQRGDATELVNHRRCRLIPILKRIQCFIRVFLKEICILVPAGDGLIKSTLGRETCARGGHSEVNMDYRELLR